MDIRKQLLKGHTRTNALKIADYVGNSPGRFKELIGVYLSSPYRITQRAAAALSCCVERTPKLVVPHLNEIINVAKKTDASNAIKRNTVRLLQYIDVPPKYHGRVLDLCYSFLINKKEQVAIKVFSMTVLAGLAKNTPDLQKELKIIIEDQLPYTTAAFISRARKILKQLS